MWCHISPTRYRIGAPMNKDTKLSRVKPIRRLVSSKIVEVRNPIGQANLDTREAHHPPTDTTTTNNDLNIDDSVRGPLHPDSHDLLISRTKPLQFSHPRSLKSIPSNLKRTPKSGNTLPTNIINHDLHDLLARVKPLLRRPYSWICTWRPSSAPQSDTEKTCKRVAPALAASGNVTAANLRSGSSGAVRSKT